MIYPFQEHLNTHIHIKLKKIKYMYVLNNGFTCDSKHNQIQVSPIWKQYYNMAILFIFALVKAKSNDQLGCP
jgi:hypothetical protein